MAAILFFFQKKGGSLTNWIQMPGYESLEAFMAAMSGSGIAQASPRIFDVHLCAGMRLCAQIFLCSIFCDLNRYAMSNRVVFHQYMVARKRRWPLASPSTLCW